MSQRYPINPGELIANGVRKLAGEALVVVFVIRNVIATILALYTVKWQAAGGIQDVSIPDLEPCQ